MRDIDLIDFSCLCCESEGELLGMSGGSIFVPRNTNGFSSLLHLFCFISPSPGKDLLLPYSARV